MRGNVKCTRALEIYYETGEGEAKRSDTIKLGSRGKGEQDSGGGDDDGLIRGMDDGVCECVKVMRVKEE